MSAANGTNGMNYVNVINVIIVINVIHAAASNRQLFEDCYQLLVEGFV